MEIFEYIRTSFNVLIGVLTPDILLKVALVLWAGLVVWCLLSIVFSYENKFIRRSNKIVGFLKNNVVTKDNYASFSQLLVHFPASARRSWKKYELTVKGSPSDYLKQEECIDDQIFGGIFKQNRSIMKACIYITTFALYLFSFAALSAGGSTVTTSLLFESALIPILYFILMTITYYIYTAIRHFALKACAESFQDMLDVMDERVNLSVIFEGYEEAISLVSNIYENETFHRVACGQEKQKKKKRNQTPVPELMFKDEGQNALAVFHQSYSVNTQDQDAEKALRLLEAQMQNTLATEDADENVEDFSALAVRPKRGRGRPRKEDANKPIVVLTDKDFQDAMERVERLMAKDTSQMSPEKTEKIETSIRDLIDAMQRYKDGNVTLPEAKPVVENTQPAKPKRGRGRPKGSKNKPKA